jgi:hypothetical protein
MKRFRSLAVSVLAFSAVFLMSSCGGYDAYIKLLQGIHKGMTPYWIPNPSDGPGAILEESDGSEILVYSQAHAFPNLEISKDNVPVSNIKKVSDIKIEAGAKGDINKILNTKIEASIKFVYTSKTTMSLSVVNPTIHRIETGMITETLKGFDLNDPRQNEILKKLQDPKVRLVAGAIHVEGFNFGFENATKLDTEEAAKLPAALADQNLSYTKTSETTFTLTATSPMYVAYYAYPVIVEELKQFYDELKKAQKPRQENDEAQRIATQYPDINAAMRTLPQLKSQFEAATKALAQSRDRGKALEANLARASGSHAKQQIRNQIVSANREIKRNEERFGKLESEVRPLERYGVLVKKIDTNKAMLDNFKKKEFNLFGKSEIISKKIA